LERKTSVFQSKLSIAGVNILYLSALILLITVGAFVQQRNFHSGILITEFVLIALPVFLYVIFKKSSLKLELRFNRLKFMDMLLVVIIFMCGYPVAMFLNLIGNIFVSIFGKLITSPIPFADNFNDYFVLLLIVAGSAGICEEILFRGLIMRGYERIGKWPSIIFTAVLFSMLHVNIQNILGPLFLGILLGYVVYTTDSIFAGMLGHFMNNAISVTIGFFMMQLPLVREAQAQSVPQGAELQGLLILSIPIGIWAAICGLIGVFCMKALKELNLEKETSESEQVIIEKLSLRVILKNVRAAWPLYISFAIFIFYAVLEFAYVITGQPLFQ
jgi:membrane protease YdiL (CAAX protease family)